MIDLVNSSLIFFNTQSCSKNEMSRSHVDLSYQTEFNNSAMNLFDSHLYVIVFLQTIIETVKVTYVLCTIGQKKKQL